MNKYVFSGLTALLLAAPLGALANEAEVRKGVEAFMGKGFKVDAVRKAGFLNLYEVQVGGDILYTDDKVSHVLIGNIIDVKARKDLTEERKAKLAQINFSDLPLDLAIKQVKGNGKRILATFEDPNCTYCKKLAKELQGMTDVTIYTFVYPIFPNSGDISRAIWCAPDKAKAWNDYMIGGTPPASGSCDSTAIDKVVALGRKLNIRGTPALFFADGSRIPGFMPGPRLEEAMNKVAAAK
jgi:thiol:disulfide interchange protein DsbC